MADVVLVQRTPGERVAYFEGRLSMAEQVLRQAAQPNGLGNAACVHCGAAANDGAELVHRGPHEGGGVVKPYAGCPAVLWAELARLQVEEARGAATSSP